jgi:hypothetical protein
MATPNPTSSSAASPPVTDPNPGNQNGVDPTAAARAAKGAEKAPKTLAIYRINHAGVGAFKEHDIVSADDLGGEANLPRLFEHGAITLAPGV